MTLVVRIVCHHGPGWDEPPTIVVTFTRESTEQAWTTTLGQGQSVPADLRDEDWPKRVTLEWLGKQTATPGPKRTRHPIECPICGIADRTWVREETVRPHLDAAVQSGRRELDLLELVHKLGA